MSLEILIMILATAVTAGTPILFAALGEVLTERAGILNLGVEGMMLMGAVTGFITVVITGNLFFAVLGAMVAAGLLALVHAFLSITLKANQVVSGLALTIFGTGFSGFLGKEYVGTPVPLAFGKWEIPILSEIPFLGPILFKQDTLVYLSYFLVLALWIFLYKTRPGLHLRGIGENPAAADAVGVNVFGLRYLYVVFGGMLAGLGGAYLSLAYAPSWLEHMTAGRGWIAVALVIFATWNPARALLGAYIFGGIDALGFRMQALGIVIPSFFLKMLPYLFTILVLIIVTRETSKRKAAVPAALGIPYDRQER